MERSTIYALSSGSPPTGVAVIRISGSRVACVMEGFSLPKLKPRVIKLAPVFHPETHLLLDTGLLLYFKGPESFTGEDILELQLHGGRAVIDSVLDALQTMPGVKMAEPGEFSRRAFENGKLDLTEVEGLADLIAADTEAQRVQALGAARGVLSELYEGWRRELLSAIALVESSLDFSDEGDVPPDIISASVFKIEQLKSAIEKHLDDGFRGEILRDGFRVVIAGPPNAGKSSLLNALAKRDVAIVSGEEGTTRDVISVRLDIDGYPVHLSDTAGIRETSSEIELEGIRRVYREAAMAELIIWMVDGVQVKETSISADELIPPEDVMALNVPILMIWNKVDGAEITGEFIKLDGLNLSVLDRGLSAVNGSGLDVLIEELGQRAKQRIGDGGEIFVTRARHRALLQASVASLGEFLSGDFGEIEFRAEDLRRAGDALGRITGKLDVEDVLEVIFAEFCIGK